MKKYIVILLGILSFLYLIFPSMSVFELIPDAIPFIGSIDEATATTLLLACLSYFGIELTNIFKRGKSVFDNKKVEE